MDERLLECDQCKPVGSIQMSLRGCGCYMEAEVLVKEAGEPRVLESLAKLQGTSHSGFGMQTG